MFPFPLTEMSYKCNFLEPSASGEKDIIVTSAEGKGVEISEVSFSFLFLIFFSPDPNLLAFPEEMSLLYLFC